MHTEHALWIGDLPLLWTASKTNKYLGLLLREYLPQEVPQPWIQRVHRKAYKSNNTDNSTNRQHLGYAIVVFRDAPEMELVLSKLNGIQVVPENVFSADATDQERTLPSFTLRIKPATVTQTRTDSNSLPTPAGMDPPVEDQLRPFTTQELIQRIGALGHPLAATEDEGDAEHSQVVQWAADILANQLPPRPELHHRGRLLPTSIQQRLLSILQNLRWAVPNSRNGLTAERYLVLQTNSGKNDRHYGHLREACQELMEWADPNYYYSGIAVTHNFVASPHIDDRDQSFQYAVSLGDFTTGGELCVDGKTDNGNAVLHVVNTQNRIAKVDGRHVHWVRAWEGGERYSLIFYDTTDRFQTPVMDMGVDLDWCSSGN